MESLKKILPLFCLALILSSSFRTSLKAQDNVSPKETTPKGFRRTDTASQNSNTDKLDAGDFHIVRDGLKNAQINFQQNKFGRIAFLGGSITYGGGWRDSLMLYFKNKFPETKFDFINAGIPSMGSTPSAFRLEKDILSKGKTDLLFVEAAVNDAVNGFSPIEQIRAMEGIVRHLKKTNPAIDIVMMHFVDPEKIIDYNNGKIPEVIRNHSKVAAHYNIPEINLAKEVAARINNKEFTWENDFKNLHPSPFGHGVYASSMIIFLEHSFSKHLHEENKITATELPKILDKGSYDKGYLVTPAEKSAVNGWAYEARWKPLDGAGTRSNYVDVPMLTGTYPTGILRIPFFGTAAGLAIAAGPDAGIIAYRIDGGDWRKRDLFTEWSNTLHLPWYFTLASDLKNKQHVLEIKMSSEKNERSKGRTCRIRYFYINGDVR
ncbi:SGNH/GDSL hydrolase family protein [Chitinophaga sp. GCM10012297]|uniref:SGNH/GDSL hydrolase family protein n=1 Tax=Chitinophaga chungangae TaxID=2821488 RepID=A0ABS3YFA4_9BACT|nr:SGNH/GDSL hydrolase family protein [Chitinophaga chungangae]MBO9153361.1 SGNH/GDSL hydrolase family protein [Chitinophaga chungangae]